MKIRQIKDSLTKWRPKKSAEHLVVVYDPYGVCTDKKTIVPCMIDWWCKEVHRRAMHWNGIVGNFTILEFFGERLQNVHVFPVANGPLVNTGRSLK